jgi:outer membrane protein OmpA-like peptidoglycan-associated protein
MDETFTFHDGNTVRFRGFTLSFGESSVSMNRETLITSIGNGLGIYNDDSNDENDTNVVNQNSQGDYHQDDDQQNYNNQNQNDYGNGRETSPNDQYNFDSGIGRSQPLASEQIPEASQNIEMTNVPEGIKLTINDLRFVADSDELLPEENPRLEKIAEILQTIPDRFLLIEGHTAAIGRADGEMQLSIERAKKITDELSARGIAPDRFVYKGWGGTKPVGDNSTDAGRRLNRRVEITIME